MMAWQYAQFMTKIAATIEQVPPEVPWGDFYVSEVHFGFEGDDAGFRLLTNEHGGYDISVVVR